MKLLCCALLFTGCLADDPIDSTETAEQALVSGCPDWGCGMNSPVIDGFGFHELDTQHSTNLERFRIESVTTPWSTAYYDIKVVYGEIKLTKIGSASGPTLVEHDRLTNSIIHLDRFGTKYDLKIAQVAETALWVGSHPYVESYVFGWHLVGAGSPGFDNVCSNPSGATTMDGTLLMPAYQTVVFEGERIVSKTKKITGIDSRWFNLGCAGSPLAKMYLTGHVGAAIHEGFSTTVPERQTILRMFAADYCGGGFAFTIAGQPLEWKDDHNWMVINRPSKLEARWTPDGAKCLNTPRIYANPSTAGSAAFPLGIYQAIHDVCGASAPPPCADSDLTHQGGFHLLSGNPITP